MCPKLGSKRVLSDLLESQRRQLIEEQIVRRKPTERIHDWRIVRQQDDSVPDDPVPDDPSPPSPMTTVCLVLDQSVQTETPVEEVDHLRRRFEHNRRRLQVRFDQQMAAQRRRQQSQEHLQRLHQRFLRINSHRKTAILRGKCSTFCPVVRLFGECVRVMQVEWMVATQRCVGVHGLVVLCRRSGWLV